MSETGISLRRIALPIFGFLFWFTNSFASQVVLKNGDRITGVATVADKESLTINSSLIGEVRIPWSAVERADIKEKVGQRRRRHDLRTSYVTGVARSTPVSP
jgi:hypothetical protein